MIALVKREFRVERDGDDYTVVELQTVREDGKRKRTRKIHCGYFPTWQAADDYKRFTFGGI